MKRILVASLLMAVLTTPAIAGQLVYLKDGGVIRAKSAWRSGGRVHVLVNRDTLTEFTPAEIDMKRTFAGKVRKARRRVATRRQATASQPVQPAAAAVPEKSKAGFSLPSLPSLPERSPESLKGTEEGAIRKHKREMEERAEE